MPGGDSSTRTRSTCTSSSCTTIAAAFGHTSKATGHASLTTHHRAQTAGTYGTERKNPEDDDDDDDDDDERYHTHSSIVLAHESQMTTQLTTANCIDYAHGSCLMCVGMRSGRCPRGFLGCRSSHAWRCVLHYLAQNSYCQYKADRLHIDMLS